MSLISYLYPQTIAHYKSKYNDDIRIVEEHGKYKILVNGSPQSGPYIKSLWDKVFNIVYKQKKYASSVLMIGIAGGTAIYLIHDIYPQSNVIAVDIDKVMITVGTKYFGLENLNFLNIFCEDARKFIKKLDKDKKKFDIIVSDIFIGSDIPDFVSSDEYIQSLKDLADTKGIVVINYLREKKYKSKSDMLLDKLLRIFHSVIKKDIFLNSFFICNK